MAVENRWVIEDRVILTELIGNITVEELVEASQRGTAMIEAGISPVYSLVDMSRMGLYPRQVTQIGRIASGGRSDKLGWVLVYGIPHPLVNFLAVLFSRVIHTNFKVVKDQQEALALVEKLEAQAWNTQAG